MSCINPNSPEFQQILKTQSNPMLAELLYDKQEADNVQAKETLHQSFQGLLAANDNFETAETNDDNANNSNQGPSDTRPNSQVLGQSQFDGFRAYAQANFGHLSERFIFQRGSPSDNISSDQRIIGKSFNEIFRPGFTDHQRGEYISNRFYNAFTQHPFLGRLYKNVGESSETPVLRIINDGVAPSAFTLDKNIYLNTDVKTLNFFKALYQRNVDLDKYVEVTAFEELIHLIAENKVPHQLKVNALVEFMGTKKAHQETSKYYSNSTQWDPRILHHEFIRSLVQNDLLGYTTEDVKHETQSPEVRNYLRNILQWLRDFFKSTNYNQQMVGVINNYIKAIDSTIQFNRPVTYQEQLEQFTRRNSLVPITKDGINGYKLTMQGALSMGKQYQKTGYLYEKLALDYNKTSGILEINPKQAADRLQMNREAEEKTMAREIFDKTIQPIADKLGFAVPIVLSIEEAYKATEHSAHPYNGESAFNLDGQAYVLDSALTLTNGIHEVIHPFIDGVMASNPALFNKLYDDLIRTNTGARILQNVTKGYADFSKEDQQKEVIVRALAEQAKNNIEEGEQVQIKGIFARLWYAIKQLLRQVFGKTIRVENLNENTTLAELAEMLTGDTFKIVTTFVSEKDVIQFNKQTDDMMKDLETLEPTVLNKAIEKYYGITQSHVRNINKAGFADVKNITNSETGRNEFVTNKKLLSDVKDKADDEAGMKDKIDVLTHVMSGMDIISEKIADYLKEVSKAEKDNPSDNTIEKMSYFKTILLDYQQFYSNLIDDFTPLMSSRSETIGTLNATQGSITSNLKQINKINSAPLVKIMGTMLSEAKEATETRFASELKQMEDWLAKEEKAGNKKGINSAKNRLEDVRKEMKKFDLSDENLERWISGENGDINTFTAFLESAISSGDPIIGGFMAWVKTSMYAIQGKVRNIDVSMRDELGPLMKAAGIDRGKVSVLGSMVTHLDQQLSFKDGEPVMESVITLLSPHKNYQYVGELFKYNIQKEERSGDKAARLAVIQEKEVHEAQYMNREFIDEYYKAQDIYKTPEGIIAKDALKAKYDAISLSESLAKDSDSEDEVEQRLEYIKILQKDIQQLGSLLDLNGNTKNAEDTKIAQTIIAYKEASRKFYKYTEKPGLFETKYNQFKHKLELEDILENTEEFDDRLAEWVSDNMKVSLKNDFYEDRQAILDRVAELLSKLPDSLKKELEVSGYWKDIIEMSKGFRDEDGQPMGADMTLEKVAKIKALQEKIIEAQNKYTKLNGLTGAESEELANLFQINTDGGKLSTEERATIKELLAKKSTVKASISELESTELFDLFQKLKDLQSKVPTDYYLEIANNWTSKLVEPAFTASNTEKMLDADNMNRMMAKDEDFKEWFLNNHILKQKWSKNLDEFVPYYEKLYIWNKIVPNDPKYFHTYKLSTGKQLLGTPTNEYFTRTVKDEYKTGYDKTTKEVNPEVGVHIDNKGNWLPLTAEQAKGKADWEPKFVNEAYYALKNTNPSVFKMLGVFTKYHLASQEDALYSNKLWMELPRFRKEKVEYLQSGHVMDDASKKANTLYDAAKSLFKKTDDDFDHGAGNFERDSPKMVSTDIFNNEMIKVPIQGLSHLPVEHTSLDIGSSIIKHIRSLEVNKELIKMQPVAIALLDKLEDNGVKNVKKIAYQAYKLTGIKAFLPSSDNKRAEQVKNIFETIWQGKANKMELGEGWDKAAQQLMRLTAFGTLFVNAAGSVKNMTAATVQGFIEGIGGEHITGAEFARGFHIMGSQFAYAMVSDTNKFSDHTYETQLMRMFDFVQGKSEEKLGHEYSSAFKRNIVSLKMGFFGMEMGEMQAQGGFGLGLMIHQKLNQTQTDGSVKEINYLDAFEKKPDGKIGLKEGIDPEWAEGGAKFNAFKLKSHNLSEKLQGNYAGMDQPESQRYTAGRLVSFMRRYFVPAVVNRFSGERMQSALAETREGYYKTAIRMGMNAYRDHQLNWNSYSPVEKRYVFKMLSEVGISMMFLLLLRSLGWNENDKDKMKKLQDNSWLTNHLIYQLMAVKGESEQFVPLPGMGLDDIMRTINNPTIALGHMNKWYKLMQDFADPAGTLDQKSGFFDKGDNKVLVQLAKISGFNGGLVDPIVNIKNLTSVQSHTK